MTAPAAHPRHPILPDLGRSRAVLVECHDDSPSAESWPAALPAELAQALAAEPGPAFDPAAIETLTGGESPDRVIGAVRRAAEAASDVLLLYYAGSGARHEELLFGQPGRPPRAQLSDPPGALRTIAGILSDSRAARLVVLLDCDYVSAAWSAFTGPSLREMSLLATHEPQYWVNGGRFGDSFTTTLLAGLTLGVQNGPPALDLVTLRNAVEAEFHETRYRVENEYVDAPSKLRLHGGDTVALGLNPALAPGSGWRGLPLDTDVVDEREA